VNVTGQASDLLTGLMAQPWGQVTVSIYETGRLVALAPRLTGHRERVAYLLAHQRPDGSWGAPDGYGLVPTLSATDALLGLDPADGPRGVAAAARAGLAALRTLLSRPVTLPDMPAADLIVPALIERVNAHGAADPLPLPAGMDAGRLGRVRQVVASGAPLPQKLLHALEVAGATVTGTVRPTPIGTVGASPAATAAWMTGAQTTAAPPGSAWDGGSSGSAGNGGSPGDAWDGGSSGGARDGGPSGSARDDGSSGGAGDGGPSGGARDDGSLGSVRDGGTSGSARDGGARDGGPSGAVRVAEAELARGHLEAVVARYGGPVPVGLPITVFERGWVLSWLARAGVPAQVPPEMTADLRAAIGPAGTPAGAGLPADADTTSVALYALALLGLPCEPDSLLAFDTGTHFCTWQGEDGFSVSVNAHALDALGAYAAARPDRAEAYAPLVARQAALLAERQRPDGCWDDRWHASPYYATLSCALALGEFGGPGHTEPVRRAREWVLSTQRPDGSWGRWAGTAEETAYALQTLLLPVDLDSGGDMEAVRQGYAFLRQVADTYDYPALWHDKDLYAPIAVVRAAILAALHLAQSRMKIGQSRT